MTVCLDKLELRFLECEKNIFDIALMLNFTKKSSSSKISQEMKRNGLK